MKNSPDNSPLDQTVEIRIKPSQVAIAGLTLLAVFAAALLVLRLVDILILVFVSLVIAATLRPMVAALRRRGIPKALALVLILLGILGVLGGLFMLVIPALVNQGGELVRSLPQIYTSLVTSLNENPNQLLSTLPKLLPTGDQLASQLQAVSGAVLSGALSVGVSVVTFITQLLAIIALSIYLTLGQSRLERFWLSLVPAPRRPELLAIWREIESRLGGYVRGEFLLMTSIGVLASLGYWAIGLPYPLALGVLAGLLEFVPMVGPTLGAIPAVIIALAISPQTALLVVLYTIIIQVVENNLLVPRLMGHSVGVSPVVVIIAIFAFTSLLGIAGAFLAIPLAAVIQVLMDHLIVHAGFTGTDEPDESSPDIMATLGAQIRRLRAEGLQRLRTRNGRITLSTGDRDDLDRRADQLLNKADQALTKAAQTEATDTAEEHTEHLAQIGQLIDRAGVMVEDANAEALTEPVGKDAHLAEAEMAIDHAGEIVEDVKAEAEIGRENENALLDEADLAIDHAGEKIQEAKAEATAKHEDEKTP